MGNQEDAMNPETALYMQILEIQMARTGIYNSALRVVFIILVSLKLDNNIIENYWIVFIPFWIYFLPSALSFIFDCMKAQYLFNTKPSPPSTMEDDEEAIKNEVEKRSEIALVLARKGCGTFCYLLIFLTIIVVGVCRLQEGTTGFSTFWVFFPIFLLVGLFLCIMGCMICLVPSEEELDEIEKEFNNLDGYENNNSQNGESENVESGANTSSSNNRYTPPIVPEDTIPLKSSGFENSDKSYNTITTSTNDLSVVNTNVNDQGLILGNEKPEQSTSLHSDAGDIDD